VSCNKKNVTAFAVPEPTWESEQENELFTSANQHATERKITDRLSFKNSPRSELQTFAECSKENKTVTQGARFQLPARISLFEMLPPNLLKPEGDLEQPVYCSISFQASSNGSSHTFYMIKVRVHDSEFASGIESVQPNSVYRDDDLNNALFRLRRRDTDLMLSCTDFSLALQRSETSTSANAAPFSLNEFPFPVDYFSAAHALQKCRLIGLKDRHVHSLSREFQLYLHHARPIFETHLADGFATALRDYDRLPLYNFRIANPAEDSLRLKISKSEGRKFSALIRLGNGISTVPVCGQAHFLQRRMENLRLALKAHSGVTVQESEKDFVLEIPGRSSVEGTLLLRLPGPLTLNSSGVEFLQETPLDAQILDESWTSVATVPWSIQEKFVSPGTRSADYPRLPCP
jgi:hypothetical protein